MLDSDVLGALYLIIFRLAVVAAGIVSIFCGYRLFLAGVFGQVSAKSQTQVEARFSGVQLTLKSAAPGTCFAFFGVIIIATMMFSAPPQFNRSHITTSLPSGETTETQVVGMRGYDRALPEFVEDAKRAEKMGDKKKAIKDYELALRLVAEPLNNLAFLYHDAGRDNEALPLAKLATQFAPTESEFADTLNKIPLSEKK